MREKTRVEHIFLDALKAGIYLCMLLCDALIFKIVKVPFLHSSYVAASGIIFSFSFILMDTISNVYGFEQAKRTLFTTLSLQVIFCLTINFFVMLNQNINIDSGKSHAYYIVYHDIWRILFSSTIGVFSSFYFNSVIISLYKRKYHNYHYLIVYYLVNCISMLWLVIVSYSLNFFGVMSIFNILKLMFFTWIFKISIGFVLILTGTPLLINLARTVDKEDIVDHGVNYKPVPFIKNNFGENFYGKKI